MYSYLEQKSNLFTEEGQVTFLEIRDKVNKLLSQSGAVLMRNAIGGTTGNVWLLLACVDRMVELNEIEEVRTTPKFIQQYRIFIKRKE